MGSWTVTPDGLLRMTTHWGRTQTFETIPGTQAWVTRPAADRDIPLTTTLIPLMVQYPGRMFQYVIPHQPADPVELIVTDIAIPLR